MSETRNPPPQGECTCEPDAGGQCDYCYEMQAWAHYELYPEEDLDCEMCGRSLGLGRGGICNACEAEAEDEMETW